MEDWQSRMPMLRSRQYLSRAASRFLLSGWRDWAWRGAAVRNVAESSRSAARRRTANATPLPVVPISSAQQRGRHLVGALLGWVARAVFTLARAAACWSAAFFVALW